MLNARGVSEFAEDGALLALLKLAARRGYRFVTPTPATHQRIIQRNGNALGRSMIDILGWSLPFERSAIRDDELLECLTHAAALECLGGNIFRSLVRVSWLRGNLFLHSAFPTDQQRSVFFGPDSHRFADLIVSELRLHPLTKGCHVADIGTGTGVGAVILASELENPLIFATDVNPSALRLARANLNAAGVSAILLEGDGLAGAPSPLNLITINPPYLADEHGREYRDGGGMMGSEVSLTLAHTAMSALASEGRVILYSGSAIMDGHDRLRVALADAAERCQCSMRYREIDPDVFGEELDEPSYRNVERIAAVAAIMTRY